MNKAWIKLSRSIINDAVFTEPEVLKVWIWILCKAFYVKKNIIIGRSEIEVMPGQFPCSRQNASAELNLTESKFYRILKLLEKMGSITIKSNNKFTLICVEKWDFFQSGKSHCEQQMNNKRTTNEQQTNTIKKEKNIKNINNNNYNARTHARDNNCVPTPKSTKFNNFKPSGDIDYAEFEKQAFQKQIERIRTDEQVQEQKVYFN